MCQFHKLVTRLAFAGFRTHPLVGVVRGFVISELKLDKKDFGYPFEGMGDGFRGRSSTWSAGTTSAYGKGDLVAGLNEDCKLAYPFASLRSGQFQDEALSLQFNDFSDLHSPKLGPHYSPASSTTATELGSQEFHLRSHLLDKTPDSDYGDTRSNLLTVMANTSQSSPSRSMRDWNTSFALSMGRSSGFQDVSSSSTFSTVSSFGTLSQGVVTPCGTGAGSSSSTSTLPPFSSSAPYPLSNGSGFPDAATLNKHCPAAASAHVSGSPSPANSQVSLPGPLTNSTTAAITGSGGATNSAKRPARRNPWGAETYSDLIANAIESYPEKQATLQQIYDYISRNYIYFRERSDPPASAGWKFFAVPLPPLTPLSLSPSLTPLSLPLSPSLSPSFSLSPSLSSSLSLLLPPSPSLSPPLS
nr:unnamed protein product [Spirometra erinaceieuropaei]